MNNTIEFKDLPIEVKEDFKERTEYLKQFDFKIIKVVKEDILDNYFNYTIYGITDGAVHLFVYKFLNNNLNEIIEDSMCKSGVRFFLEFI